MTAPRTGPVPYDHPQVSTTSACSWAATSAALPRNAGLRRARIAECVAGVTSASIRTPLDGQSPRRAR